jgi:hypothetical protein
MSMITSLGATAVCVTARTVSKMSGQAVTFVHERYTRSIDPLITAVLTTVFMR